LQFVQQATSQEQSNAIGGGIVGQTSLDSIAGELMSIGGSQDVISFDFGKDDLGNNIGVGEAGNQTIFGAVVFILGLGDEPLAGTVISLAFTPAAVFDLKTLEISLA